MKTFVPKTKSDQKWLDSLICYMDYIHKFMVFPTMNTIYQNKKIGVWMNNQKRFKKVYKMPSERMELLSKVLPVWDKETDEKQAEQINKDNNRRNAKCKIHHTTK